MNLKLVVFLFLSLLLVACAGVAGGASEAKTEANISEPAVESVAAEVELSVAEVREMTVESEPTPTMEVIEEPTAIPTEVIIEPTLMPEPTPTQDPSVPVLGAAVIVMCGETEQLFEFTEYGQVIGVPPCEHRLQLTAIDLTGYPPNHETIRITGISELLSVSTPRYIHQGLPLEEITLTYGEHLVDGLVDVSIGTSNLELLCNGVVIAEFVFSENLQTQTIEHDCSHGIMSLGGEIGQNARVTYRYEFHDSYRDLNIGDTLAPLEGLPLVSPTVTFSYFRHVVTQKN